jgi:hypothetical protein
MLAWIRHRMTSMICLLAILVMSLIDAQRSTQIHVWVLKLGAVNATPKDATSGVLRGTALHRPCAWMTCARWLMSAWIQIKMGMAWDVHKGLTVTIQIVTFILVRPKYVTALTTTATIAPTTCRALAMLAKQDWGFARRQASEFVMLQVRSHAMRSPLSQTLWRRVVTTSTTIAMAS